RSLLLLALESDPTVSRPIVTRIGAHEVHGLEFGTGERVLVLLHGLSGSSRWWARNIPALSRKYRLIVPDLIGFGRSRGKAMLPTIHEAALLISAWIDTLDVERITLVGHSMGGQLAVHVAARDPERIERLVLVDAAGMPRDFSLVTVTRFAAEVAPIWRWGDPRFLPIIARDALTAGPRVLLRAIWHILRDDVRPLLPGISAPTLIIWGERDTLVPLKEAWAFREGIPDAKLVVLRGAGHNPMVDRPADFNRLLERFLDGELVGR
ncbi:MAG TPA: alpha/beta hydrolase, partial [Longimicrobiaceae bacterium]|nr:alpha/beta hydrolase [Longimicrobiaceae bacterium]